MSKGLVILITALMAAYTIRISLPLIKRLGRAVASSWNNRDLRKSFGLIVAIVLASGHVTYYPMEFYARLFELH